MGSDTREGATTRRAVGAVVNSFDRIVVIFNPHSTGRAPQLAEELRTDLVGRLPSVPVSLLPTREAGHARQLARDAASTGHPLIVSVSGDGGYNEVIDGVMHSGNTGAICAVMAAGNANDHHRTTGQRPLAEAIQSGQIHRMDLLRLTVDTGPMARIQYAHSYIGLGLTPAVAIDLEKGGKGSLREIVSTIRTFTHFHPFTIELEDGSRESFDSLLFANITQMAKYATLSEAGRPDDGRFEVIALRHTAKWRLMGIALKAATSGLGPQPTARRYNFTTLKPTPLQLDGELLTLETDTAVRVEIVPAALATIG